MVCVARLFCVFYHKHATDSHILRPGRHHVPKKDRKKKRKKKKKVNMHFLVPFTPSSFLFFMVEC